jgi:hypothetical protein
MRSMILGLLLLATPAWATGSASREGVALRQAFLHKAGTGFLGGKHRRAQKVLARIAQMSPTDRAFAESHLAEIVESMSTLEIRRASKSSILSRLGYLYEFNHDWGGISVLRVDGKRMDEAQHIHALYVPKTDSPIAREVRGADSGSTEKLVEQTLYHPGQRPIHFLWKDGKWVTGEGSSDSHSEPSPRALTE